MSVTPEEREQARKLAQGLASGGRIKVTRNAAIGLLYTVLFFVLIGVGFGLGIGYLAWHR